MVQRPPLINGPITYVSYPPPHSLQPTYSGAEASLDEGPYDWSSNGDREEARGVVDQHKKCAQHSC